MSIYMVVTSLIILPVVLSLIVSSEKDKLENRYLKDKIEVLYEGLNIKFYLKRAYFLVYCIRRFLFVGLAFLFTNE